MKIFFVVFLMGTVLILSQSCSDGLVNDRATIGERSASNDEMKNRIESGSDEVKKIFIDYLKQNEKRLPFDKVGIDFASDYSKDLEVRGIPTYFIDSTSFVNMNKSSNLKDICRLDERRAEFFLYHKGRILLSASAIYNKGKWERTESVGHAYINFKNNMAIPEAIAGESEVFVLNVYKTSRIGIFGKFTMICKKQGNEYIDILRNRGPVLPEIIREQTSFIEAVENERIHGNPFRDM